MIILLHTSKTMRLSTAYKDKLSVPQLLSKAAQLAAYLQTLSPSELQKCMHISATLAATTQATLTDWSTTPAQQSATIFSFVGDIYSGLQAGSFTEADLQFASQHLRILSGLYGVLRPLDGIMPYRLEMGYKLPHFSHKNLYEFWGEAIAETLPSDIIINLAAMEYSKAVLSYSRGTTVITPKFLTADPATGEPAFVVVHAKIARGAFARWLITQRIGDIAALPQFTGLGYRYVAKLSTAAQPVFVCQEFGGKGLSVRLIGGRGRD